MSGDGFAVSGEPYFQIRFSALNAHHDKGIKGISNEIAERLVKILENSVCEQNGVPKETNECVSNGESGDPEHFLQTCNVGGWFVRV